MSIAPLVQHPPAAAALSPSVSDEVEALSAIYESPDVLTQRPALTNEETLQLRLDTSLPDNPEVPVSLLCRLPVAYPEQRPPRLSLESKYLGPFLVDSELLSQVSSAVQDLWSPGVEAVCYEALESARELCRLWYESRASENAAQRAQEDEVQEAKLRQRERERPPSPSPESAQQHLQQHDSVLPEHLDWALSEPILDRKSAFVGRAIRLASPADVRPYLRALKQDKKINKATHNMVAWRCRTSDGVLHLDNDDDGESAAGSRMAHLLDMLKVDNVLVVVSRWYGGIHLGPDRFKHISTSTRGALVAGQFI